MDYDTTTKELNEEEQYEPFSNQVGGHTVLLRRKCDSSLIKPANSKELSFYHEVFSKNIFKHLIHFMPKYYGSITLNGYQSLQNPPEQQNQWLQKLIKERLKFNSQHIQNFIKLEDITQKFKNPSILDLKMGFISPSDKLQKKYENTTSKTLGFRICGMSIYLKNSSRAYYDKYWGRTLKDNEAVKFLGMFFNQSDIGCYEKLIKKVLKKLSDLLICLKQIPYIRLKSSSILIVYEDNNVSVKIIDFGNCIIDYTSVNYDRDMITATENLIQILEQFQVQYIVEN